MDLSWEYTNCLQTHECGDWDLGRVVFTYIIHKSEFFAVWVADGTAPLKLDLSFKGDNMFNFYFLHSTAVQLIM